MSGPESQIERLELQIEELAGSIRQSQKLMLVGQSSAAAGVLALIMFALSTSLGLVWFMTGVAMALGGLVLMGASKSTTEELQRALTKAQTDRTHAIDALSLKQVQE